MFRIPSLRKSKESQLRRNQIQSQKGHHQGKIIPKKFSCAKVLPEMSRKSEVLPEMARKAEVYKLTEVPSLSEHFNILLDVMSQVIILYQAWDLFQFMDPFCEKFMKRIPYTFFIFVLIQNQSFAKIIL